MFVEAGTSYGGSGWVVSGVGPLTIDTSNQAWVQFSGAGEISAGQGLTKSGNTLNVYLDGSSLQINGLNQASVKAIATSLLSGLVSPGNLGSGAATAATVLCGDQTYRTRFGQYRDKFNGNGSVVNFDLSYSNSTVSPLVFLNGELMNDGGNDYSFTVGGGVSGNGRVTFTTAPDASSSVVVVY